MAKEDYLPHKQEGAVSAEPAALGRTKYGTAEVRAPLAVAALCSDALLTQTLCCLQQEGNKAD